MDRLDEALTICRAMFSEDRPSFSGTHDRIERALDIPRPVQPGGPRILIGGAGEQRTLPLAAKHADPATIERTMATPVPVAATEAEVLAAVERMAPERRAFVAGGTPEQAAGPLRPYLAAGFTGLTFNDSILDAPEKIGLAGELLRLVS